MTLTERAKGGGFEGNREVHKSMRRCKKECSDDFCLEWILIKGIYAPHFNGGDHHDEIKLQLRIAYSVFGPWNHQIAKKNSIRKLDKLTHNKW
jgi:hypothetical protein